IIAYGHGLMPEIHSSADPEVKAALEAIKRGIKDFHRKPLLIVSDSTYVTDGLSKAYKMARSNAKYRDLWMELVSILPFADITAQHVKGHKQQTFNTLVDWICREQLNNNGARIDRTIELTNISGPWRNSLVKVSK